MTTGRAAPRTIDEYVAGFPSEVQQVLEKVRTTIRRAAPDAEETISYGIPTFRLKGNLVHFAAYERHVGFYPTPTGMEHFKKELSAFEGAKGSVKFPLSKQIPLTLIAKIVAFRVEENLAKATSSAKRR